MDVEQSGDIIRHLFFTRKGMLFFGAVADRGELDAQIVTRRDILYLVYQQLAEAEGFKYGR